MSVDSDNTVAVFIPEEIKVQVEDLPKVDLKVDTEHDILVLASGAVGEQGAPGPIGPIGEPGEDGSRWYAGPDPPEDTLGQSGDYYLEDNGEVWVNVEGHWGPEEISLKGPQGDTGPPGPVAEFPGSPLLVPANDTRNAYSGPSGRIIIASKLTADTQSRLTVDVNGVLKWGGGSAVPDISLSRWQAGMLALGTTSQKGQLRVVTDIPSSPILDALVGAESFVRFGMRPNQLEWGPGTTAPDTVLVREGVGILALGSGSGATGLGTLRVRALVANSWALACIIAAEANPRFLIRSHGAIEWGDGVNPQDTFLNRAAGGMPQVYGISNNYTGTLTAGSPVVTGIASTVGIAAGMQVHGPGITLNSTVLSVDSATQITLSANAASSGSQTFAVGRRTCVIVKSSAAQGTWGLQAWQDSAGANILQVVPAQVSAPSGKLQWRYGSLLYEQDPAAGDSTARMVVMPNGDRLDIYNEAGSLISGFFMPGNIRFFDGLGAAAANLVLATIAKNIGIRTATEFGGGSGVIGITNAAIVPTTNPTGGGILYADNGDLKWRRPDGTVQVFGVGGAQGPQGDPGTPGESWFTGSGAPAGTLSGSIVNDWYIDSATGDYYEKTGTTTWTLRGNLRGPAGATGAQGPTGATGSQGPAGAAGGHIYATTSAPPGSSYNPGDVWINPTDGNVYDWGISSPGPPVVYGWIPRGNIKGPAGAQGATGATGSQGPAGTNGTNGEKWFSGSGAPAGSLSGSVIGDWYLDTANGDVYEKTATSTWTNRGNLKGPAGTAGAAGEKWFTGAGAPSGGLGAVGDWFLRNDNGDYLEKIDSSNWTTRGNLRGPTGATGPTGPEGPVGQAEGWLSSGGPPNLVAGNIGDWYLDTNNGDVYEKTAVNTYTLRANIKGPAGERWYTGSGTPDIVLGSTGAVGDWYLDSSTGTYWEKTTTTTWVSRGNLKGPKGDKGDPGTAVGGQPIDIQSFETAGSFSGATGWQKPAGATMVLVVLYGGGGGGGGAVNNSNSAGAGGGGGARVERWYKASELAAQEPIVVAAQTAAAPIATDGDGGNASTFSSGETAVSAYGGGGGSRGGSAAVRGGGGGGGNFGPGANVVNTGSGGAGGGIGGGPQNNDPNGSDGGAGGGGTAAGSGGRGYNGGGGGAASPSSAAVGGNGGGSVKGGCGGASGGINANAGGDGGSHGQAAGGGGAGGSNVGGAGTTGAAGNMSAGGRGGGGGGGRSTTGTAGSGGDGGAPGGGGGGAGGGGNATAGGGGRGARGAVYVVSF